MKVLNIVLANVKYCLSYEGYGRTNTTWRYNNNGKPSQPYYCSTLQGL